VNRYIISALLILSCFGNALAADEQAQDKLPKGYLACPTIKDLHKSSDPAKMNWFANDGWMSHSPSFANHIKEFLGAQWQGRTVGNVSCLYRASEQMTFPIVLQYNVLSFEPSGGKWSKNLGGYLNCMSHKQKDCVFKPRPKPKAVDVYREAEKLQGHTKQEMGF